jgi:monoamine oxidase
MPIHDADVVVVGAGVAGIAAASALRQAGLTCTILEAGPHAGGRAHTTCPSLLGGAPFDHGAVWLHMAETNPLTAIARAAGEALTDTADVRSRLTWLGDRFADAAERAALDETWERYGATGAALAEAPGPDRALAAVGDALAGDPDCAPWLPLVEAWEADVIDAAPADAVSLRDWHVNGLEGGNLMFAGGMGDFVRRRLLPLAGAVTLGTPATAIDWSGDGVAVTTPAGTLRARAVIVTVSTAVLAAEAIRFTPALPVAVQDAIAALPLGLATKVALRAAGPDRLDLPAFTVLDRKLARRGEPFALFNLWPFGRDHVIGWIGGGAAFALAREGDAAAEDFARSELRRVFGARADRLFAPGAVVTAWQRNPRVLGAYSNARPGQAEARHVLATPLADGRLVFAGEACHVGLAGTVGGAWLSGIRAASVISEPSLRGTK